MNFIYKILQNLRSSIDKLFLEPYNKSANSKGAAENPAAPFSVSLIMKIPGPQQSFPLLPDFPYFHQSMFS